MRAEEEAKVSGEDVKGFKLYSSSIGNYMHRLILRIPFIGTLRIHHIMRSDLADALHDHPFDFWSIILVGSYFEVLKGGEVKFWPRWSFICRKAETPHRIIVDEPVWTLVWAGPNRRKWGFWINNVWTYWREAMSQWETERRGQ